MTEYIRLLKGLLESLLQQEIVEKIVSLIQYADTVFVCGNGACSSISDHLACDLTKTGGKRTISLSAHTGMLTAYANDFSYAQSFSFILDAYHRQGEREALLAFSASGTSANVRDVIKEATILGIQAVPIFGDTLFPQELLPTKKMDRIQVLEDCFWILGHWIVSELRKKKETQCLR